MTRADLAAGVLAAALLAAPVAALAGRSQDAAKETACLSNLRTLWISCHNYAAQYGGREKSMPADAGADFWLRLKRTPKPVVLDTKVFFCPLSGHDEKSDATSYRGPKTAVATYGDEDPVGADLEGNHGPDRGGSVIQKHGAVVLYGPGEKMWRTAGEKLVGTAPARKQDSKDHVPIEKRIADLEKAVKDLTELVKQLKEQLEKEGK